MKDKNILIVAFSLAILAAAINVFTIFCTAYAKVVYIHRDYAGQAGVKYPRFLEIPAPYIALGAAILLALGCIGATLKDRDHGTSYAFIAIFGSASLLWLFFGQNWI